MNSISLNNVGKKFRIGSGPRKSFMQSLRNKISGVEHREEFWALKNVSINLSRGDILGIVGANGSGKSTLLSTIAGIYEPDQGTVQTSGTIVSAIGLAHGLKDRLTLKENITLCCTLFGMSRKNIRSRFKSIVEFAELENYVDTKLFQFSLGMIDRLVFSIALQCRPDILLLDEVTNHADASFREKSSRALKDICNEGTVAILVSHEQNIIEQCSSVLWLDKGQIKQISNADEIINEYFTYTR